jgi:protease inhibitor Inh
MSARVGFVLIALAFAAGVGQAQTPTPTQTPAPAPAPAPAPNETARGMVGAWEISNAARDKTCPLTFSIDAAPGGYKVELDSQCATAFPSLKDVVAWTIGPKDGVRLVDSKGAVVLDFTEVESRMYEAERKGEGLFFMRTQAAIKAATVSPEQVFGDWTLLQEFEKPLCKLTLSNAAVGGESYRITVKPGCAAAIVALGFSSWKLDSNELLLTGRGATWRFSESDATIWERIPPSGEPMVLMRQ